MPVDIGPFIPPTPRVKDKYDAGVTMYDDWVYTMRGMTLVKGLILNNTFGIPYFLPERAYLIAEGQIHLMPELGS